MHIHVKINQNCSDQIWPGAWKVNTVSLRHNVVQYTITVAEDKTVFKLSKNANSGPHGRATE